MSSINSQTNIEFLRRRKILYAVVDPAQIRNRHPLLFKKVFDLTFVLTQRLSTIAHGDVEYFDTIDEAISHGRFWDLLIIQSVGNFIIEYRFLEELAEVCRKNRNFFMLGFPPTPQLEDGAGALEFDSRMMVVNVDTWKRLPGLYEKQASKEDLPNHFRMSRTVQDSLRPLSARGSHKGMTMRRRERDRSFLNEVMSRGLILHNFPESLRDCSLYIWPALESHRLYEALTSRDESLVSNSDQKRWIRLSKPKATVWIYNSEPYRFNVPVRYCDAYFGPAAGFKYLDILSYNAHAEFLFYDQNEESLEWIKTLKCNWDGNDFADYLRHQPEALREKFKYVNSSVEDNQRILFEQFGGEEDFKRRWHLFRSANAKFVRCDLFNDCDVDELMSKTNAARPFFYYSNIFSTNFTLMAFSREEADKRYRRFMSIVKERFPNVIMHGADIAGQWH